MLFVASVVFAQESEKKYPDIDFNFFNGKKMSMDELVSKGPIVMQFWAIWCAPCKKEMYYLDKIQEKKNGHRQRHSKIQITKILSKSGKIIAQANLEVKKASPEVKNKKIKQIKKVVKK